MYLHSNGLSDMAMISSLLILKFFPACFSCRKVFFLSQRSIGFSGKKFVKIPESVVAGDLGNLMKSLSLVV